GCTTAPAQVEIWPIRVGRVVRKAATLSRRFGRPSPVRVYWLARCEGFQLRCGDRTRGVVKRVLLDASNTEAKALVVRVGRVVPRSVVVPAEEVEAVAPFEEVLVGVGVAPVRRARGSAALLIRALAVLGWSAHWAWVSALWLQRHVRLAAVAEARWAA